jgi:hypothetical protein
MLRPACIAVSLFYAAFVLAQGSATHEEYVTIWRDVPNGFHRSDFPSNMLAAILDSSPSQAIRLTPDAPTVSDAIRKTFNISETWTPTVYGAVLQKVQHLNPGLDFSALPPNSIIKMPRLPVTGKSRPGKNPLNNVPNLFVASTAGAIHWSDSKGYLVGELAPSHGVARAAQSELQYFRLPASEAKRYLDALKRLPNGTVQFGASGKMSISLAGTVGTTQDGVDKVLPPGAAGRIRERLAIAGKGPRPIVVILDDSIPDSASFTASKHFILDSSETIRTAYALGPSPNSDDLRNLPDGRLVTHSDLLYPNLRIHSAMIHAALDEFADLDVKGTVNVVYLPLAATQIEAIPIIREILYLGQLLKICKPMMPPTYTATVEQREKAQGIVDQIIKDDPALLAATLQPFSGSQVLVETDSMFLESLSIYLNYYSRASMRPHVLSFSWTVPDSQAATFFQPGAYGWKVTAAGNGPSGGQTVNVLRPPLQFAYRGLDPKDFLVVANSTGTPSNCPSNTFDDPPSVKILGLAFPGNVSQSICGTSFSAPRVAWLLGAREVLSGRRIALGDDAALDLWISSKEQFILDLQGSSSQFFDRYRFDIEKLLGISAQH